MTDSLKPLRAAIYTRISRDSELLGEGVHRQDQISRELVNRRGYELRDEHVYEDNDIGASTSTQKARPDYQKLIAAIRAGQIDVVVAYSLSRLTRRVSELLDLIELHRQTGVLFATCVSGDPDLSTADGRAVALTVGTWDQAEAERTSERLRAFTEHRAQQGFYASGVRPFGYRFATDENGEVLTGRHRRLVIDADEAAIVREMGQRVLGGEALWHLVQELTARGVRTSTGALWQTQTLRKMLMRWVNAGMRSHRAMNNGKHTGELRLHKGAWEPIVTRETHEAVIATLTDPRRKSNQGKTSAKYLLTWLVDCGGCGRKMVAAKEYTYTIRGTYVRKDGTRSPDRERTYPATYRCPHSGCHAVTRRMDVVDEFVETHLVALLEAEGVRVLGGNQVDAEAARGEIAGIEGRMALIGDQFGDGGMSQPQFDRQNRRLMGRLEEAKARLRAAQPASDLEEFAGEGAAGAWSHASVRQRRQVIQALIELAGLRIIVDPVGPGATNAAGADPYKGIRVEWAEEPQRS